MRAEQRARCGEKTDALRWVGGEERARPARGAGGGDLGGQPQQAGAQLAAPAPLLALRPPTFPPRPAPLSSTVTFTRAPWCLRHNFSWQRLEPLRKRLLCSMHPVRMPHVRHASCAQGSAPVIRRLLCSRGQFRGGAVCGGLCAASVRVRAWHEKARAPGGYEFAEVCAGLRCSGATVHRSGEAVQNDSIDIIQGARRRPVG